MHWILAEHFWDVWDAADVIAVLVATFAFIGYFVTKKTSTKERSITETVDADVLSRFSELFERLVTVEADLKAAKLTIDQLREEIQSMRKVEEFLEAKVHEREGQIRNLKAELVKARKRIDHLEMVCRRAGINGDILGEDS